MFIITQCFVFSLSHTKSRMQKATELMAFKLFIEFIWWYYHSIIKIKLADNDIEMNVFKIMAWQIDNAWNIRSIRNSSFATSK